MANQEHLDILKQGVKVWNEWREQHPDISPDLSHLYLPAGANLQGANLRGAKLYSATLREANLREAKLRGARLWDADLRDASDRQPRPAIVTICHSLGSSVVTAMRKDT